MLSWEWRSSDLDELSEQPATPSLIVKGLIAVSCIDLLAVYVSSHPKKQFKVWNTYSYDWNVQLRRVSPCVEAEQQMGGEA